MDIKSIMWHPGDNLLDGITFQELIDTVISNEKTINYTNIYRVFNDLMNLKIKDARYTFDVYYYNIRNELYKRGE